MNGVRRLIAIYCLTLMASCGGGGGGGSGGGDTKLSVSPNSINFDIEPGAALPLSQIVTTQFVGDGVVGGYGPGVTVPDWLSVETVTQSSTSATFRFSLTRTNHTPGTYRTTFRFVTGREDGSAVKVFDLPVTLNVSRAALRAAEGTSFTGFALAKSPPSPQSVSIGTDYSGMAYSATVTYSGSASGWLNGAIAGTAPSIMRLVPNTTSLAPGEYMASIRLTPTSGRVVDVVVRYSVVAPWLKFSPGTISKTISSSSSASDLTSNISIEDAGAPVQWRVIGSDVPWIRATPPSGSTESASSLAISIDRDFVQGATDGDYAGTLTIGYSNSKVPEQTAAIPVALAVRLPTARFIGPNAIEAGRTEPVVIYGYGLAGLTASNVSIGGKQPSAWEVLSDSAARLTPPSLTAGSYNVQLSNGLGGVRLGATLSVVQTPAFSAQEVQHSLSGPIRAIYDAKRKSIYVATYEIGGGASVHRLSHTDSGWTSKKMVDGSFKIIDIALSGDADSLYLTSPENGRLYSLKLDSDSAMPVKIADLSYENIVTMGDGRILGVEDFSYPTIFDPRTSKMSYPNIGHGCPRFSASVDGSRVFVAAGCSPRYNGYMFDVVAGTATMGDESINSSNTFGTNRNGQLSSTLSTLFDDSLRVIGSFDGGYAPVFSPDSKRLISVAVDSATGANHRVLVSDVTLPLASDGAAPTLLNIPISDAPIVAYQSMRGMITPDGKYYLLLDREKLRVIPVSVK